MKQLVDILKRLWSRFMDAEARTAVRPAPETNRK
jgi:hypothetical protein